MRHEEDDPVLTNEIRVREPMKRKIAASSSAPTYKGEIYQVFKRFFRVLACVKSDFHSIEFSVWTGNLLFTWENVVLNLNRVLRMTNILLSKIKPAQKFPLTGNCPSRREKISQKSRRILKGAILERNISRKTRERKGRARGEMREMNRVCNRGDGKECQFSKTGAGFKDFPSASGMFHFISYALQSDNLRQQHILVSVAFLYRFCTG